MVVPKVAVATVIPQPAGKMAPPGPVRDRRRKTHGLYFHSSPPKVLQMNNQNLQRDNDNKTKDALVIKPSNIRIWLHQKHIAKLTKVLWAGQGMRLRTETSHHPKMKRFLECVPHVMGVIKDIHQAVVDNDLDTLKERTASPTPRIVLTSKDANGLTPLHKAAGLAHTQIVEYILSIWPSLSSDEDHTGKTPLHWAASAKNNARSFNLLVQAGADEAALDHRDKPAEYYKNKPSEIDRSLLTVIPEAPRVSQQGFPAYFDWAMFTIDEDSDDSNGSRMKPFLSQNNLLDNDVNSYDSVSKSKSVHNLTNGTLTDLPNDGEGESEAKNKDSEEEEEVETAANPTESAGEEDTGDDGAVVEAEEEQQDNDQQAEEEEAVINGAAEEEEEQEESNPTEQVTNQAETEATGDRDGGDDGGKVVTADDAAAAENEQTEQNIETGECEQVADGEETGEVDDGGKKEVDVDDGTHEVAGVDTVVDDLVKGAITSAKSVRGGDGVDGMANGVDVGGEFEANGELTNDSLESDALGANGGDEEEIDQDSLNKPDEEVENGSVGNREISAQSKTGTRNSSAATLVGKGSRPSTVTISNHSVDRNGNSAASGGSRVSSAVGDNLSTSANNSAKSRPVSSSNSEQSTVKINSATSKKTIPDSAKSMSNGFGSRNGSAISVIETNNNQDDQSVEHDNQSTGTRPPSRVVSGRELSATSRAQSTSSTVRNGSASSGVDRKQQRSAKSGTSQKSRRDVAEDGDDKSDSNDDSNQADVEIIHYKSSNEAGPAEDRAPSDTNKNDEPAQNEVNAEEPVEPEPAVDANDDDEPDDKVASPSPALEIAGTVLGEPDGGQLHSAQPSGDGLDSPNEDRSVRDVIETGDMEQLAVIVLNGEGKKLLGQRSELPEIQAFLDNVPSYMNKIRRVHVAARDGSLRDLQSALDRRKFATARDEISPHGATPLHVATIFGHSGIVRYLAGRFPETTSATDNNGRTPMHYAATLKDNGHFYNLLNHLGANPKAEDNLNHPAEYYLNHDETKDLLSHRQLLQDYGAEEDLADDMLNDQELSDAQVEIPLFRTEEGRYLATSLGDPLIKGLTEVANRRPADPITYLATYLYNFANQSRNKTSASSQTTSERATTLQKSDSNNNSIDLAVKEDSEQELESGVPQPTNKPPPVSNGVAEMPLEREDQGPPSPDDSDSAVSSDNRDEHGQSMLHFACARSHGKNALIQLIEESGISVTYRDELYRTARDVSLQATQPDNAREIDRFVLGMAARGDLDALTGMLLDGYDHIVDVAGTDGTTILQVASSRGHRDVAEFLEGAREFEEKRENLLTAIREKNLPKAKEILQTPEGQKLARAKNYYGRCSLHIAVLMENEDIVEYLASNFRATLKVGDNLERTPIHYAMGISNVEAISRILIKNGAKRVMKDLKGRQPSYYFMNKADILRLQEEERE
ncbi:uncharacterized protein LOC120418960 isoform X2 [Culex pipiens pallens]|uniref:uncharacterized protein LOC120418960 isoform X2 n=1 Tax=Culex pipiens pallens TaxID=42434 RepID=UPI0022AB236D|nr:uncharacterized protein LOC120418960 isoform X2 [Culex pipiens pallens]